MLTEKDVEELVKFSGVQHNPDTSLPRAACPACLFMDKYFAHRTEILALAWGFFKLERAMERKVNPPIFLDLKPGALNTMPGDYIKPKTDDEEEEGERDDRLTAIVWTIFGCAVGIDIWACITLLTGH